MVNAESSLRTLVLAYRCNDHTVDGWRGFFVPESEDRNGPSKRLKERVAAFVIGLLGDCECTLQLAVQKFVWIEERRLLPIDLARGERNRRSRRSGRSHRCLGAVAGSLPSAQLLHGPIKRVERVHCIERVSCVRLVQATEAVPVVIASRALDVFDQLMHVKSQ